MITLKSLPDDILAHIVEYLNPLCSQKRLDFLCVNIIPCVPYLTKFFKHRKDQCDMTLHTKIPNSSSPLCVCDLYTIIPDKELCKSYFRNIIMKLTNDDKFFKLPSKKNNRYSSYTCHFKYIKNIQDDSPIVWYLKKRLFPYSPYRLSHLCCGGIGIYATNRPISHKNKRII